jgi:transposase
MQEYTRNSGLVSPRDYDLFVGLDVDKSSIAVTVREVLGGTRSLKMPYDPEKLLKFIDNQYPEKKSVFAYEAGPTGYGLHDAIEEAGGVCIVVSPAGIPEAPASRVKTNRLDSQKIASLLFGGQLKGIHVPSREYRELRSLVHLRYTYMADIRAYKCRIKAEMLKEGIPFPKAPAGSQWSNKVIDELKSLDCSAVTSYKIESMLSHLDGLKKAMALAEAAIRSHIAGSEELARCMSFLMSLPGIGFRIASYALARIGDYRHLGRSEQMSAFFGLVPRESSTGERTNRGSITRLGDARLRTMLVQGAWMAIRTDPGLREFFLRVCTSHNARIAKRVAIVAVARKLAMMMSSVLKGQRTYSRTAA